MVLLACFLCVGKTAHGILITPGHAVAFLYAAYVTYKQELTGPQAAVGGTLGGVGTDTAWRFSVGKAFVQGSTDIKDTEACTGLFYKLLIKDKAISNNEASCAATTVGAGVLGACVGTAYAKYEQRKHS
jgi:hypothetical protein